MTTAIDFRTDQGRKIQEALLDRLEELRIKNDSMNMSERETCATRGAIAEIRRLLTQSAPVLPSVRYSGMSRDNEGMV